jgi:hypothetical protein
MSGSVLTCSPLFTSQGTGAAVSCCPRQACDLLAFVSWSILLRCLLLFARYQVVRSCSSSLRLTRRKGRDMDVHCYACDESHRERLTCCSRCEQWSCVDHAEWYITLSHGNRMHLEVICFTCQQREHQPITQKRLTPSVQETRGSSHVRSKSKKDMPITGYQQ